MQFRNLLASLPFLIVPVESFAESAAQSTPAWCCPTQCEVDHGNARLLPREDGSGAFDLMLDNVRVPIMPGAFHGTSDRGPMRFCVGYDAFGDRQIKCLFVPSIV